MDATIWELLWRTYQPGSAVMVDEGPLEGLSGTVVAVDEKRRLIVMFALMPGVVPVTLDPTTAVHVERPFAAVRLTTH
jgi:transcription antitermination factor NusG